MPGPKRIIEIDENTKVPLSLAWVVGVALVSIAMIFSSILAKQETAQADILDLKSKVDTINQDRAQKRDQVLSAISDLRIELGRIETKLHIDQKEDDE